MTTESNFFECPHIEPLPEHLKAPEWLWVRKLRTGRRQWLNRNTCQLVPMP